MCLVLGPPSSYVGGSHLFYLGLMRLPANHVKDLEGGGDGPVLVPIHLCNKSKQTETSLSGTTALRLPTKQQLKEQSNIFSSRVRVHVQDMRCNLTSCFQTAKT